MERDEVRFVLTLRENRDGTALVLDTYRNGKRMRADCDGDDVLGRYGVQLHTVLYRELLNITHRLSPGSSLRIIPVKEDTP